jgi:hypothetical protein
MKEDETGHVSHMGDMRNTVYTRGSPTMGCAPSGGAIGFLGGGQVYCMRDKFILN